ncbi:hypothetical protein HWQ46_02995 [Shewanella sp. D64]|uniref:hypothetical protein n=1 Tax=unclassified Shewanella TaxID=196818 RepID=UPI0022BA19D6|nr:MULTISPECIES: hypothetical protein [unclassified Shewanella]MEC4724513.1 hypothetical protein [Shewanella sp. D64]MEC4736710.1 hypothetical protein [Shewanella sp. E94]WBJ94621.1 hypothetical protein HWQ47_22635 [Shewanella sp. MTB7]
MIEFASPEMQQYLRRRDMSAILMTELDFESGWLRCHSGVGDAIWQEHTFKGTGVLGKVGAVKQGSKVQPHRLRFTLSGIPKELAAVALGEKYQNRHGALYLAALDPYSNIVAVDTLFAGRMDVMNVRIANPSTIQLDLNSRGVDWKNSRNRRYTHADQISRYRDDNFFEFVSQMAEKEIHWGVPGKVVGGSGGSNRGSGRTQRMK